MESFCLKNLWVFKFQSGDYINDNHIKVVIEVSKQLDYKKFEDNEDEDNYGIDELFAVVTNILHTKCSK